MSLPWYILRCDFGNINATVQYNAEDMSEGLPRMMHTLFPGLFPANNKGINQVLLGLLK